MGVPHVNRGEIREVTITLPYDVTGASVDLQGWLTTAGPDVPWHLLPQPSSDGQGVAETIGLLLDSSAAAVALYDRVREWLAQRKPRDTHVRVSADVELNGKKYQLTVILEPEEDGNGRAAGSK